MMRKTIWLITDEADDKTELTYYHFGKDPQFPNWYMDKDHSYTIEMMWNCKLLLRWSTLYKCLVNKCVIARAR